MFDGKTNSGANPWKLFPWEPPMSHYLRKSSTLLFSVCGCVFALFYVKYKCPCHWTQKKVVSVSTDYKKNGIVDLLKEYFNCSWSWAVTVIHKQRKWRKKGCGIPFCSKCSQPTTTRMHWVELDKVKSSAGMWCSASWAVLCGLGRSISSRNKWRSGDKLSCITAKQ